MTELPPVYILVLFCFKEILLKTTTFDVRGLQSSAQRLHPQNDAKQIEECTIYSL